MPPPQCPECGRFLATVFVEEIRTEPAPCPGCGAELFLDAEEGGDDGAPSPTHVDDVTTDEPADDAREPEDVGPGPAATTPAVEEPHDLPPEPADVAPEPETSVRPPDRDRDPLAGWDEVATAPAPAAAGPAPEVVAVGAGAGLVLGLLLGGSRHRVLGALLGAVLGAVLARLRT